MKKGLALLISSALILGVAQAAFANDENVVIVKESMEGYMSEVAYSPLDSEEYKIADVMNKAVEDGILAGKIELSSLYKGREVGPLEFTYYAYQNTYDSEEFVSVVMNNYNYSGGAHGYNWVTAFTGYKDGEELLALSDFFVKDKLNYSRDVKNIIKAKIAEEPEKYYQYADTCVDDIPLENNFYIDEQGNVVIFYNPYDIAPYAAGVVSFKLSADELKGLIKDEVYAELKNIEAENSAAANIRYNGVGYVMENAPKALDDNEFYNPVYVPVRDTFEMMGIEVKWNEKDGVILDSLRVAKPLKAIKPYEYVPNVKNIFEDADIVETEILKDVKLSDYAEVRNINGKTYIKVLDLKEFLTGGAVITTFDETVCVYY